MGRARPGRTLLTAPRSTADERFPQSRRWPSGPPNRPSRDANVGPSPARHAVDNRERARALPPVRVAHRAIAVTKRYPASTPTARRDFSSDSTRPGAEPLTRSGLGCQAAGCSSPVDVLRLPIHRRWRTRWRPRRPDPTPRVPLGRFRGGTARTTPSAGSARRRGGPDGPGGLGLRSGLALRAPAEQVLAPVRSVAGQRFRASSITIGMAARSRRRQRRRRRGERELPHRYSSADRFHPQDVSVHRRRHLRSHVR